MTKGITEHDVRLTCPLCENEKSMKGISIRLLDEIHISFAWVCDECPAILFEYYDRKDYRNIGKYLRIE